MGDGIVLHRGAYQSVGDLVPDESVHLCVTSPPYDNLRTYGSSSDYDVVQVIELLKRVIVPGGVIVWVTADATVNGSETGTSFRTALQFMKAGFNLHDTMIYLKDNPPPVGGSNRYFQAFEYCFVFSKGKPATFNPIVAERRNKHNDKRTTRFKPVVRNKDGAFTYKQVAINTGMVKLQNVWAYTVGGGFMSEDPAAHAHPAIFPEPLVRDHIISWSNSGDTVFDPMMGSGTVGVVAKRLGRKFIGIEVNEQYFDIAESRINQGGYEQLALE